MLWVLLNVPRAPARSRRARRRSRRSANLEASVAARIGHAIEPAIAPLGFDWKIGVGLVASLAAREVIVSTLAQIYAVGDTGRLHRPARRASAPTSTRAPAGPSSRCPSRSSLLVFFVFALQCTSTIVVMARETGSWRWPALAFSYMLALAWTASFATFQISRTLLPA